MRQVRVYVPASLALLKDWSTAGAVPADSPERYVATDEQEESEYAALMAAAAESRALGGDRRLVVVADVPGVDPDAAFDIARVMAVHLDEHPGARDHDDLAWYSPEELPSLFE